MQGSVWGSLLCTSSMDMLGKSLYSKPETLYQYKGVPIPPLGMVDDIICVTNADKSEHMNNHINTFIEHKNLTLSSTKCYQIHIGKGHQGCPKLRVHEKQMKETGKEKYLGDMVDQESSIQATIDSRKSKALGIITGIMSILNEIPLGRQRMGVAMKREVLIMNGILYNSEAWHGVTKKSHTNP